MNIFSLLSLIGGMAFFLFGMNVMSENLEKMAGGQLERMLKKMTANPVISLGLGAMITIAMQSSSATTVLLVGLVNSGIMNFSQTLSVIFGANIGTTLTAWILSLSGIESSSLWLQMLKPINFSPILALLGIIFLMTSKSDRKHSIGKVLIGFAVLMYGMTMMSDAVGPLAEEPYFQELLGKFANPVLGLLIALAITAIIQSSAASIGILQALSLTGTLSVGTVIPMIMGLNIGTCATSLIACIGTGTNARRVAVVHTTIKVLGALICLPLYLLLSSLFAWDFIGQAATPVRIALIHTVYNLLVTLILMPATPLLVRLTKRIVPEKSEGKSRKGKEKDFELDERLFRSPSVAIAECANLTVRMSGIAHETLLKTFTLLRQYDHHTADWILEQEDRLDHLEDRLGTYLVRLSGDALSQTDSRNVSRMLHAIGDFERLGDHAVNLLKTAQEIHRKEISFSPAAREELRILTDAVTEILEITAQAYEANSVETAVNVEPLEQVIDHLIAEIKDNHIRRLQEGNCTIELGFVLSDILTNMERISDHCSNIAVAVIETAHDSFDTHRYLNTVKGSDEDFRKKFRAYDQKYALDSAKN